MTTYGDLTVYDNLKAGGGLAVKDAADVASGISNVTGYVFDLFQADISLAVDPSYAAALLDGGNGFTDIQAVATFDLSASMFNNLFFITVDSSDIDDLEANDIIFSVDGTDYQYPFIDGGSNNIAFSNSTIQNGAINNKYVDQSLKKDIVRHIAYSITGGYAVADIFSNEADLLADVVAQDASLHEIFTNTITGLKAATDGGTAYNSGTGYTADAIPNITDVDEKRFFKVAQSLYSININDTVNGRQQKIYEDLSNNSFDSNGAKASVTIPLRFEVGDAIALRIQYDPNSSPVSGGGMGGNEISSRAYKILIPLS